MTTAQPAIRAGIASPSERISGKFHGLITPTTGYGRYWTLSFLTFISGECAGTRSSPMYLRAFFP